MKTALLLGQLDWPENLCLARALHDEGWRVEFVSADGYGPIAPWLQVHDIPAFETGPVAALLAEVATRPEVAWILPLDETTIQLCNELAPDEPRLLPRIPAAQLKMLENKSSMSAFAASVGVRVPESVAVDEHRPLAEQAARLGYPLVLKGEIGGGGEHVALCADEAALRAAQARVPPPQRLLQRLIQGRPWKAGGFYVQGRPVRRHAFEVLRQAPAHTGPPAYVRNGSPPALLDALDTMAAALAWTGYFQVDLIRDARGDFHFLEINPRPWSAMIAALPAGTPIFEPLCNHLAGREPRVALEQNDSWQGYVFPRPLSVQARALDHLGMLRTLCTPAFWRSAPPMDRHCRRFLFKCIYWDWQKARRRNAARDR